MLINDLKFQIKILIRPNTGKNDKSQRYLPGGRQARKQIAECVEFYNKKRLHSSLYYLTPDDYLNGRIEEKLDERENKLNDARNNRIKSEIAS